LKKWRDKKTKWSAVTLNNNNKDKTKYRRPKMLLLMPVMQFSKDLKPRKFNDVHNRNSWKTLEMNFTSKKVKKLRFNESELKLKNVKELSKNFRRLKISNCV